MFSGIVEEVGNIQSFKPNTDGVTLTIKCQKVISGKDSLAISDSVSISGACLTVTEVSSHTFTVQLSPETIRKTWFAQLAEKAQVNLERALKYGDRVGGHLVQGHVEATATVEHIADDGNAKIITIKARPDTMKYIIEKGFITIDGVSLTCFNRTETQFSFSMIPYTAKHTTLGKLKPNDTVNIETDMTAKYVEQTIAYAKDQQNR